MTLKQFFKDTTKHEAVQAAAFEKHFSLETPMCKIPYTAGKQGDYLVTEGSEKYDSMFTHKVIEFKSDTKSLLTKHFYIEFEQTNNGWETSKPSGHKLAVDEGCLLVIGVKHEYYCFD